MTNHQFTLLIPTKNRLKELKFTLEKLKFLHEKPEVKCIICDDGSTDGTSEFLNENYPQIFVIKNETSKGIHNVRNNLLNKVETQFALSIDDDAHFITEDVLINIEKYFNNNSQVGLISFRSFWNLNEPEFTDTIDKPHRVKSFGAVGFAIRVEAWKQIPNFLEWFKFYGEEDFCAIHLFKKNWEIHYLPKVLVHHRVNIKNRKTEIDYAFRLRRSLRSDWYLYFLFYPFKEIPRRFLYTLWTQIKLKIFKGNFKAFKAISLAVFDLLINFPRLINNRKPLTNIEFKKFHDLPNAKIYWEP